MQADFNLVYQRINNRIRTFVETRVSDKETANDLVQDIFLNVHRNIHKLEHHERLDAWVFRIARNRVTDYYRTRKLHIDVDDVEIKVEPASRREIITLLADDIQEMVNQLPEPYREVIQLTELEGLKYSEVAERLNLTVPAVKSRVLRGREKMKEILLDCCHFEFDRNGGVIDFTPRKYCQKCVTIGINDLN